MPPDHEYERARLLSLALDSGFDEELAHVCLGELTDLYGTRLRLLTIFSCEFLAKSSSGQLTFARFAGNDGQDFVTVELCGDDYLARLADCSKVDEDWDACEEAGDNAVVEDAVDDDYGDGEEDDEDYSPPEGNRWDGLRDTEGTQSQRLSPMRLTDSDDDDVMIIENPNQFPGNLGPPASGARGANMRTAQNDAAPKSTSKVLLAVSNSLFVESGVSW